MAKPTCPPYLRPLLALFARNGERAYPVGGCVRDTLLGATPHDWDVAVTTDPETTMALCEAAGYRTIPTGIKHGTVTVLLPLSGDPSDGEAPYEMVECTTCRTEGGYADGRHPDAVSFTGRIEDDLSRRDFTVNAMAFSGDGEDLEVVDLFGGRADLAAGIIRAVGDPDRRFSEDALRLLRAVRFAVRLGFAVEAETLSAMSRCAGGLARISRERISDELSKILSGPDPLRGVAMLCETGLMPYVLPRGISPLGAGDLPSLPAAYAPRLACLQWGMTGEDVAENLRGLRLSNAIRRTVTLLTESAATPVIPTPREARVWRAVYGEEAELALAVRLAQTAAVQTAAAEQTESPTESERERIRALAAMIRASEAAGEPVRIGDLALGGRELIALGVAPGPRVQALLQGLLELVWEDPAKNTPESLTKEALSRKE